MSKIFKDANTMGVIISRMQVPYLTSGHINLIKTIQDRHNKLLVLLGVSNEINIKNPFSFDFRRQMIQKFMRPCDNIMPVRDNKDNSTWVKQVDYLVGASLYSDENAILYGSRDSFIPYYEKDKGSFRTQELLPEDNDSGTELRSIAATKIPLYTPEVAEAIIYTVNILTKK